jgi:hypothetical protein
MLNVEYMERVRCLKIVRRQGKSSRITWSNHFLFGRIISLNFLTFLSLWIFVFLLACKENFLRIHPVY